MVPRSPCSPLLPMLKLIEQPEKTIVDLIDVTVAQKKIVFALARCEARIRGGAPLPLRSTSKKPLDLNPAPISDDE